MKGVQAVGGKVLFAGVEISPDEAMMCARALMSAAGLATAQIAEAAALVDAGNSAEREKLLARLVVLDGQQKGGGHAG